MGPPGRRAEVIADLSAVDWTLLVVAALAVGFAKTAISGVGSLAVALFALAIPARESTGALLPLLIAGDVVAVALYARHGSASTLLRLLPGVIPGLLLGALFIAHVGNQGMQVTIGAVLLMMCAVQLFRRRSPGDVRGVHPVLTVILGAVAGFATMTANAAGPVMTLYLVMTRVPMMAMLGISAWFFLTVNLLKVPLSTSLDLISPASVLLDACLVPAMLLGAWAGRRTVARLNQRQFETIALALSMVAAGLLVVTA